MNKAPFLSVLNQLEFQFHAKVLCAQVGMEGRKGGKEEGIPAACVSKIFKRTEFASYMEFRRYIFNGYVV